MFMKEEMLQEEMRNNDESEGEDDGDDDDDRGGEIEREENRGGVSEIGANTHQTSRGISDRDIPAATAVAAARAAAVAGRSTRTLENTVAAGADSNDDASSTPEPFIYSYDDQLRYHEAIAMTKETHFAAVGRHHQHQQSKGQRQQQQNATLCGGAMAGAQISSSAIAAATAATAASGTTRPAHSVGVEHPLVRQAISQAKKKTTSVSIDEALEAALAL